MAGSDERVFLNVPFDSRYQQLFAALVFAVHDCGFVARCPLEIDDSGESRLGIIGLEERELTFSARRSLVIGWLDENPW
jgi:hypothetical protein